MNEKTIIRIARWTCLISAACVVLAVVLAYEYGSHTEIYALSFLSAIVFGVARLVLKNYNQNKNR